MLHRIEIPHPVERAADGLMLGNGDLSLSCYQKPGKMTTPRKQKERRHAPPFPVYCTLSMVCRTTDSMMDAVMAPGT